MSAGPAEACQVPARKNRPLRLSWTCGCPDRTVPKSFHAYRFLSQHFIADGHTSLQSWFKEREKEKERLKQNQSGRTHTENWFKNAIQLQLLHNTKIASCYIRFEPANHGNWNLPEMNGIDHVLWSSYCSAGGTNCWATDHCSSRPDVANATGEAQNMNSAGLA